MIAHATSLVVPVWLLVLFLTQLRAVASDTPPASQPVNAGPVMLHAGPIRLKFQDGELRYLRVGDREIVRRIYFGVRDGSFGTALPSFSEVHVDAADDHFRIHLAASNSDKTISYDWTADITGSADGVIEYRVSGAAPADGASRRIGLCVLFGAQAMAGHQFELLDKQGNTTPGEFPRLVSPSLVGKQFYALRYSADALHVQCGVAESPFDMEDQRNWGDSSFKAYNTMPYAYPKIEKGLRLTQTLKLTVQGAGPTTQPVENPTAHVRIGAPIADVHFPAIGSRTTFADATAFPSLNQHREKYKNATAVTWPWTTATHLPDDDIVMENLPAIVDQARTIRSFAPRALLRAGPISMNGRWPDYQRPTGFAAAWTADAIKYVTIANVDELAFSDLTPEAQQIIALFQAFTGKPMLDVHVEPAFSEVDAFAAADIGTTALWLVNRSDSPRHVAIDDVPPGAAAHVIRLPANGDPQALTDAGVDLGPYEVCEVTLAR